MTSRREEYSSSNVVRTLHPVRPISPVRNNSGVENNLDHLLEDLETTVNRTANHLNSAKRDVQYLKPSNSTTVVEERSVSPGPSGSKLYKTSHYEYSSSSKSKKADTRANVDQLDNLLDDLKQERNLSFDKENTFSNDGIDPGLLDPNSHVSRSVRTYTTKTSGTGSTPKKSPSFESPSLVSSITRETRTGTLPRDLSPNSTYKKHVQSHVSRDVSYDTEPLITSPQSTLQRTHNYSKTTTNRTVPINTNITELETTDLPPELRNGGLPSDLLPPPGTKVTTTVKTFTYEIPNDTQVPTNKNFSFKNEFYNSSNTSTTNTTYPERDIPPPEKYITAPPPGTNETYLYKKETHNTVNRTDEFPPSGLSPPIGGLSPPVGPPGGLNPPNLGPNQTYFYKRETNETKNNIYGPPGSALPPRPRSPQPVTNSTMIYEHNETNTTNRNVHHPPGGFPVYPSNDYPPPVGPKSTYLYKKETTNTTNTVYGPDGEPIPQRAPSPISPPTPSQTYYKYSSEKTTTNTSNEPQVRPFPTDNLDQPNYGNQNPPKHLNQLLANFDDNDGKKIDDEPYVPRKEVNTALATNKSEPIIEAKPATRNIAGPPVFYPPGQELFAKSEAQAAWRAGGGWAKGKGKYEYEAERSAKKSSKSGAAVVPVCLPLCCAMPCSIM